MMQGSKAVFEEISGIAHSRQALLLFTDRLLERNDYNLKEGESKP